MVPLFHERVMVSTMETALEMIEAHYDGDNRRKIIGVYDAPINGIGEDSNAPVSQLALSMAEQIKQANNSLDAIILQVKVPQSLPEESEERVREITAEEEENMKPLVLNAHACQSVTMRKKIKLQTSSDPEKTIAELTSNAARPYLEIVDFDDHFCDLGRDWTNPEFD